MFLWGAKCVCLLMMVSRWCLKVRAATKLLGNCVCVCTLSGFTVAFRYIYQISRKFAQYLAPTRAFSILKAYTGFFTLKLNYLPCGQFQRKILCFKEIMMGKGNKQPVLCSLPLWVVELGLLAESFVELLSCTNVGSLYLQLPITGQPQL